MIAVFSPIHGFFLKFSVQKIQIFTLLLSPTAIMKDSFSIISKVPQSWEQCYPRNGVTNPSTPFFHKQGKALTCNIHFAFKHVFLSRARVLERQSMPRETRDWQSTKWDWQTQSQQRYRKWRRQWIVSSPQFGTARHGSIATKKSFDKLPLLRQCCRWCCYWYGFPSWHKNGVTTPKHHWMILGCSTMSFQYQGTDMAVMLTSVPSSKPM